MELSLITAKISRTMQLEIDFKKEELKQEINSFFNNIYSILICMQIVAGK